MTSQQHPSDYLLTRFLDQTGLLTRFDSTVPPKQRYGVAILGVGRAGSIHLRLVLANPRLQLCYLVDANKERLQQVSQLFCLGDGCQLIADQQVEAVFADTGIHAVIVSTPSQQHEHLTCAALRAGKHVLCEKPVALSLPALERCYDIARQSGRSLLCAFNRRYDPAFASIACKVRAGEVGQVQCISTVSRDSPRPSIDYLKISGGIFHDCIVHDVDLICHVLGEFPKKVFAAAHCFSQDIAELNDYDTVVVTMQFPSGVIAHIDISRHAVYGYDQRLEVHGSKGMLKSDNQRPITVETSLGDSCSQPPILQSFPSRYSEAYTRQLDQFVAVMDGATDHGISKEQVVKVSKVVLALETAAREERCVTLQY